MDNQPWSGEANVHVSIANWVKTRNAALLPKKRRLWTKVDSTAVPKKLRKRGSGPASKEFELIFRECAVINSALSDRADVSSAEVLMCNTDPQRVFQGVTPGHPAFVLDEAACAALIKKEAGNRDLIHPYLIGDEILTGAGGPERFILDFGQRSIVEAQAYAAAFAYVRAKVLPDRQKAAEEGKDAGGNMRPHHRQFLERWWKLSWDRAEMVAEIARVPRFLVCSRVTKRPIFTFVHASIRPGDALQVFVFADDYSFGILQSSAHWLWFITKCSKLTESFRYTPESVFNTFPWPQAPAVKQVDAVAEAGKAVRQVRAAALPGMKGGLRALYRTLELPGKNPLRDAHAALDAAVLAAYGFSAKADRLTQLRDLNRAVSEALGTGRVATSPGVPSAYPDPRRLITDDCVRPVSEGTC